jgi:hypothetical protein
MTGNMSCQGLGNARSGARAVGRQANTSNTISAENGHGAARPYTAY